MAAQLHKDFCFIFTDCWSINAIKYYLPQFFEKHSENCISLNWFNVFYKREAPGKYPKIWLCVDNMFPYISGRTDEVIICPDWIDEEFRLDKSNPNHHKLTDKYLYGIKPDKIIKVTTNKFKPDLENYVLTGTSISTAIHIAYKDGYKNVAIFAENNPDWCKFNQRPSLYKPKNTEKESRKIEKLNNFIEEIKPHIGIYKAFKESFFNIDSINIQEFL